jgi:hypothetical protein
MQSLGKGERVRNKVFQQLAMHLNVGGNVMQMFPRWNCLAGSQLLCDGRLEALRNESQRRGFLILRKARKRTERWRKMFNAVPYKNTMSIL